MTTLPPPGEVKKLYDEKERLKAELKKLESTKLQPLIVALYEGMPWKWKGILAHNTVLTLLLENGRFEKEFKTGKETRLGEIPEAMQKCRELGQFLKGHVNLDIRLDGDWLRLTFTL